MKKRYYLILLLFISACSGNTNSSSKRNENSDQLSEVSDTIPPVLDTLLFNKGALDCFFQLGRATGGKFYYNSAPKSIHKTILEIIRNHGEDNSDIAFLISTTENMQIDMDSIKMHVNAIMKELNQLNNVRLSIANYGYKNPDGNGWYHQSEISSDFEPAQKFIGNLKVSEGGDYPESTYDGLAELITKTPWRENSKKIVLVLGGGLPFEDSLSKHSKQEIIDLCNRNDLKINLFPVLINPFEIEIITDFASFSEKFLLKTSSNPVRKHLKLKFSKKAKYEIILVDVTGRVVISKQVSKSEAKITIPDDLPDGTYVVRVLQNRSEMYNAKKIIIKR